MKGVLRFALALAVLVAAFFAGGRWGGDRPGDTTVARADSVWYHASDVALLARTGRPQLIEFFHPG
jgi:hypothetical protein